MNNNFNWVAGVLLHITKCSGSGTSSRLSQKVLNNHQYQLLFPLRNIWPYKETVTLVVFQHFNWILFISIVIRINKTEWPKGPYNVNFETIFYLHNKHWLEPFFILETELVSVYSNVEKWKLDFCLCGIPVLWKLNSVINKY